MVDYSADTVTGMKSVVVVGGGFTGFECARRLARTCASTTPRLTGHVVSPVDYMLYTPLLPDVAGGVVDARFVDVPLAGRSRCARRARPRRRRRLRRPHADLHRPRAADAELTWDRLVLTPGSVTRLFDIPGLATYARGLKSTAEALYLRDHVLEQFELAHLDEDEDLRPGPSHDRRRRRLVLGDRAGAYSCAHWPTRPPSRWDSIRRSVKFVLLDLAEQVMPEVGEKLGKASMGVLHSRGIDVDWASRSRKFTPITLC